MNIEEILESFNLDPISNFENEDPYQMFHESSNVFLEEALVEASTGTTKKNIFQKIWKFIKKIFNWIGKTFAKFLGWLKGLFRRKSKPVDQVLSTIKTDIPPKKEPPKEDPAVKQSTEPKQLPKITVTIPSDPTSEVNLEPSVDMIFKDIMVQIDETKNSVTFTRRSINRNVYFDDDVTPKPGGRQGKVVGQKAVGRFGISDFDRVLLLIFHPECMDILFELGKMIENNMATKEEFVKLRKKLNDDMDHYNRISDFEDVSFTFDQLMNFQKRLNEINNSIQKVDIPEEGTINMDGNNEILDAVNEVAGQVASLQMGINAITSTIRNAYIADASYYETIDSTKTLSEFVGKCIEAAVPSKYISYNVYLLSTKKLKGKGDKDKPCWGQTRVVFFPEDKSIVHKVALSGWGIRANRSEISISNKFKGEGSSLLALAIGSSENAAVIDMERADTDRSKDRADIMQLKSRLSKFAQDHRIPLDIGLDVHSKNVGFKGNSLVAIDYGNLMRSTAN